MQTRATRRDRPSLSEAFSAATVALAVGAIAAWTTAPVVAAAPAPPVAAADRSRAAATNALAWIVSPRAARPGEVVHVRLKFKPTLDAAGKPITPRVLFAFLHALRHPVAGHLYLAEGTFGVDLLVPPGTDWGVDPIVWGANTARGTFFTPGSLSAVTLQNPVIPFVASRSAQPPLWNR